jgi:large repetitive protein
MVIQCGSFHHTAEASMRAPLGLLLAFVSLPVYAQSAEVERFRPATGEGLFGVGGARLLPHLDLSAGLIFSFASNPVVALDGPGGEVVARPVSALAVADVVAALGLFNRVELGLAVPVALVESGDDPALVSGGGALRAERIGEIRLVAKARLFGDPEGGGLSFALRPELALPVSGAGGALLVAVGGEYRAGRLSLAGALGPRLVRAPVVVENLRLGNELTFGAGASYSLSDRLRAVGEIEAAASLTSPGHVPAEARAGAKLALGRGLWLPVGAGVGLNNGVGAPDFRVFAGLTFAPSNPDPDRDGVLRTADACPLSAEDKDSFEDQDGCPELDNDKDKVADKNDRCALEPEDDDDFEDQDGCVDPDNDKDGLADAPDGCPAEPEDKDGFEDQDGCPDKDNDKDKVADITDRCPDEPEDADQFEDLDGCPDPDNDKDKIADAKDLCPEEPETYASPVDAKKGEDQDGCPDDMKAIFAGNKIVILDKIFFDTNKATLKVISYPVLDAVAEVIKAHPEINRIRVEGHTDDVGDAKKNQMLSEARAGAVLDYLASRGVDPLQMEAVGYGASKPLEPVAGKKGKALEDAREVNRRVEFLVAE